MPGLSMRAQQLLRERDDARGLEAELLLERFQRRRRAERAHADDAARAADVPLPPERGGLLDRDARRHAGRQHAVPILLGLALEDLPRRHRHHARADAFGDQLAVRFGGEAQLAARRDEDHLRIAARRIREHVGAARNTRRRGVDVAVQRR